MSAATDGSSAIIVVTEWDEYACVDYSKIRKTMNSDRALFFDLRSYLNVEKIKECGFERVFKLGN